MFICEYITTIQIHIVVIHVTIVCESDITHIY